MSSEASSSGGVDPPPQSLETSGLVNVPIFSSPAMSNVHDVIPTLPIPTMAIPSVTAGPGRSKPPSGHNFMYGPPPTLGLGMPVFESDRYTSSRVTPTPLTTASVLSLRQQMDESNHEMVNLLTQQIGTVFNPLIQNTNESYQMLAFQMSRIADFFGTPPPPPRVNPVTPQVILPAMSSTPVQFLTQHLHQLYKRKPIILTRCFTQVPEHELVEMAAGGLDYSIRKKLDTQYLRDMSQLADRVRQIERLKAEKAKNSKFQKKKEIVYDCNMVEVVDATAPVEAVPEEEYEKRVREVYPNAEEELVDFLNRCKLKNAEVMLCPRCSAVCDKEATAGLQNVVPYTENKRKWPKARPNQKAWPYKGANWGKPITKGLSIQQRLGPQNTFKPSGRAPVNQWVSGQYVTFNRRMMENGSSSNVNVNIVSEPKGSKVVAGKETKAEKVEMAKRPAKESLSIVLEEPIVENAQEGAEGEDDMEDDDLLDEGSDFDVMVNVVSILPLEYDVPTEVNELEEDFEALNLADHKPMCYYVMQNGCVEEQKAVFEKPDLGMQNHLKALFIRAKVNNVGINKVLVDGGAVVNIMPHFMLKKLGLYDTDLHSHNVVLANYEGKTGHSLGAVQLEVCVGSTVRKTLFMVIAAKPNYNLLLGREWIHGVGAVPSTMHQRLIIWREDGLVENVEADQSAYVSETGTVTLQNFDKNLASIAPCGEQDAAFDPNEVVSKNVYHSSSAWDRITAYALEAINVQEDMAVEANGDLRGELALEASEVNDGKKQRLDCIYDDEPLGFEKDPHSSIQRMQAQDPLQEVDIGDGSVKRPTYISANIDPTLRERMVELLKKYRDCFAWDYNEMPGLSRNLVEHRLPLRPDKKPVKQLPRRFALEIMTKIKAEIERLLKCKFIRTTRYVEWLANIVPVIKKNGSLRVCIDFRDLNNATPKDEYSMPVAEMLVDSAA
ncbi:unnamed protein product [Trifolium pratense]|uniref:Uncharacterized protein n=1 Tax=Trifolium pratense TaxID=57577 RepID=A0ACB0J1X8_TRIPR|nr:unnamed protein product [Trifolium pratense]